MVMPQEVTLDMLFPAADPIPGPTAVGTQVVFTGRGRLLGYSADGGAAAGAFVIFDGMDTTGVRIGSVAVAANASPLAWWGPGGVRLSRGVTVQVTAALTDLILYVQGDWRPGRR